MPFIQRSILILVEYEQNEKGEVQFQVYEEKQYAE